MSQINGKKPLSSKPKPAAIVASDDLFGNQLTIPPHLQAELDAEGLVGRWVEANKIYENHGYHPKGWVPYRRKKPDESAMGFKMGNDPEGIVRRGTLILAAKKKEDHAKHKAYLKQRASLVDLKQVQKAAAESMKKIARSSNTDMVIHEGYEDDNNEQDS